MRSEYVQGWKTSLALWSLNSGSELVYSADSGTTEPKDASNRYGLEWNNEIAFSPWFKMGADIALTNARYVSDNANGLTGNYVPNAVSQVGQLTASLVNLGPWSAGLQFRYIGPYPLTQDGSLTAPSTGVTNLRIQYEFSKNVTLAFDALNLLNRQYYDIAYAQEYRVSPNAPYVPNGVTVHPGEPQQFRLTLMLRTG